jgi:hypothetical protein
MAQILLAAFLLGNASDTDLFRCERSPRRLSVFGHSTSWWRQALSEILRLNNSVTVGLILGDQPPSAGRGNAARSIINIYLN